MTTKWSPRDLKALSHGRASGGGMWEISGKLISLSTGREIADILGLEEVVLEQGLHKVSVEEQKPTMVTKLTNTNTSQSEVGGLLLTHAAKLIVRTSLFYTKKDGERMREFRYRPGGICRKVEAVLMGAGRVTMGVDEGGRLVLKRDRGSDEVSKTINEGPLWRRGGVLESGWTYVGRRGVKGVVGVVERTEYELKDGNGVWRWVRVGKCPSWYGGGTCGMFLKGRKVVGGGGVRLGAVKGWMEEEGRGKRVGVEDLGKNVEEVVVGVGKRKKLFGLF